MYKLCMTYTIFMPALCSFCVQQQYPHIRHRNVCTVQYMHRARTATSKTYKYASIASLISCSLLYLFVGISASASSKLSMRSGQWLGTSGIFSSTFLLLLFNTKYKVIVGCLLNAHRHTHKHTRARAHTSQ